MTTLHLFTEPSEVDSYCDDHPTAICGQTFTSDDMDHQWLYIEEAAESSDYQQDLCDTCSLILLGYKAKESFGA